MIIEKKVEIRTPDGTSDGFLYSDEGEAARPGVIHLTDIGGIRASHREMARRLADAGYTVLLPNVFYRTARPPVLDFPVKFGDEQVMKRIGELTAPLTPEAAERDATAYVEYLAAQSATSGAKMGVVGYCFSGALALFAAAARPGKIAAAASFHGGRLFMDAPTSPHLALPRVKARLYFGHAVEDRSMPLEAIENLIRALAAWGGRYESEIYGGAHHGWTVPDSPSYNRAQAERAFNKLTSLFAESLK